ncbi:MAG: DUF4863 family protein [Rhodobacteraceae bacterium]|nr:DUF4863 family protein [Paracoccaceae bacterium]
MGLITATISQSKVDADLETRLNSKFPPSSDLFRTIERTCHEAIDAGWMCDQGGEGRRYGRVLEPFEDTGNLSVDVVDLTDIVGPHHRHPTGEICMVMPVTDGAQFDGHDAGWCVNLPGSDHHPTVTNGRALVLYLLPEGKIDFTQ